MPTGRGHRGFSPASSPCQFPLGSDPHEAIVRHHPGNRGPEHPSPEGIGVGSSAVALFGRGVKEFFRRCDSNRVILAVGDGVMTQLTHQANVTLALSMHPRPAYEAADAGIRV